MRGMMSGAKKAERDKQSPSGRMEIILENLFVVVLAFYPLRHIGVGLDFWDTGYNYANFQYMGTEHMDPMWLFSTYLSNGLGNLLTKLPNAGNLWGMNLYTGLFVSLLALTGFFFCYKVLKIPAWIAFAGEMLAVSLCWCPTALLYNYMTYALLLLCMILLYRGLTGEKKWCLFAAGVCLGANVLVRFSDLPQAALILAVWAYDYIVWREGKKEDKREQAERFWPRLLRHTLWCMLGYLAALAVLFGYIQIRYGMDRYAEGIARLFAMTDTATDYKPASMLIELLYTYVENLYWAARIGVILLGGMILSAIAGLAADGLKRREKRLFRNRGETPNRKPNVGETAFAVLLGAAMIGWLYLRGFCSWNYYSYDSILRPGILFLMLTMLIALIRIFHPKCPKEEKLISGLILLVVLLTSIGSNNGVYPSLNNLFAAAPYTLWQSWRFLRNVKEKRLGTIRVSFFPAKGLLSAFLLLCLFQFGLFGASFVFAEGTGVQDAHSYVENNAILENIRMSGDKARWLTEISAYVEENGLQGREVILYGQIPALSYYLQMPSAFNPWSDLDSYSVEQMALHLAGTAEKMEQDAAKRPVIILERSCAAYLSGGVNALKELGLDEARIGKIAEDQKWPLLLQFMEEQGYEQDFGNEKFTVFR